jgi:4-diphosphocytidyl-2-C-methyl-D-erythritol kinase
MRQPQMRGFGVVGEHAHAVLDQPVELVKEMSVHSHTSGDGEKTEGGQIMEVPVVNPSHGNSPGSSRKQSLRCPCRSQWQPEIMGHSIGGTERNDAQCDIFAGKALEHIVDSAVATAGNDGVESLANRHAHLGGSIGRGASGRDFHFHPRRVQNGLYRFDISQPMLPPTAGDGVVEKGGSAHASGLYRTVARRFARLWLNLSSMSQSVRSFAKINLGLRIGGLRSDGFHELRTVYQTIVLHDVIRVSVGRGSGIEIRCENPRVPKDSTNTCFKIVTLAVDALKSRGRVVIEIEKRLPVQGGLGGASGNAVATLLALEKALGQELSPAARLQITTEVGSDVPLFLIGGTVLGVSRGEEVYPLPDLPSMPCVVAIPEIAVSTPKAFADWDRLCGAGDPARELVREDQVGVVLQDRSRRDRERKDREGTASSRAESMHDDAGALAPEELAEQSSAWTGEGARPHTSDLKLTSATHFDRMLEFSREISAWLSAAPDRTGRRRSGVSARGGGRAENPLLDLVRTGIENDFEKVVFPQFPELREVKSVLQRAGARYASLSGSGSAIYGLFDSREKAAAAAKKLNKSGTPAVVTNTLTRRQYWKKLLVPSS